MSIKSILSSSVGDKVTAQGWVKTKRDAKAGVSFIDLSDGSSCQHLQVVAPSTLSDYESVVKKLTSGCSIRVSGEIVASRGKGQAIELLADSLEVLGWVEDPETYPIQPKDHSFEFLREVAHLRSRTALFSSVARIRHTLSKAVHDYLHQEGFYWIHTPIITASDAEGAGEMFKVTTLDLESPPLLESGEVDFSEDFFRSPAHLTVSGQLSVETYCLSMGRVYTFGPTFRAEKSQTTRHLAEFWMVEPEMAFADLDDDILCAQSMIQACATDILESCADDLAVLSKKADVDLLGRVSSLSAKPFEQLTYTEAVALLKKSGKQFDVPVEWGMDLQSEHERYLTEQLIQGPVIVTHYPKDIKAFYMRVDDSGDTVAAMDILVPGIGEIVGGSQREERYDILLQRMKEFGLDTDAYQWYLDLRRYGSVPHSGFGLGLDRLVQYLTGMGTIRDVIPFPRTYGSAKF